MALFRSCTSLEKCRSNYTFNYLFSEKAEQTIISAMGFPNWTLIGMGVMGVGALITTLLTYLALSPKMMSRLGLGGSQLSLRVREFVGYTLACLLLMVGFFFAGVPLDEPETETAATLIVTATLAPSPAASATSDSDSLLLPTDTTPTIPLDLEDSGSFGQITEQSETSEPTAPTEATSAATIDESGEESSPDAQAATATPTIPVTASPTSTSTSTPTVTPTATPSPIPTATIVPPLGETAVIETGGNTLWVRRTPGGQTLTLLSNGEEVVLEKGYANWQGGVWREIRTFEGILGWVQIEFLNLN